MTELSTKDLFHSTVIHEDGKEEQVLSNDKLRLEEMQNRVGGYIEIIHGIKDDKEVMMIINEEGRLKRLSLNESATDMFVKWLKKEGRYSPIEDVVGPCIVLNNYVLD